jgi:hypothetical protein
MPHDQSRPAMSGVRVPALRTWKKNTPNCCHHLRTALSHVDNIHIPSLRYVQ